MRLPFGVSIDTGRGLLRALVTGPTWSPLKGGGWRERRRGRRLKGLWGVSIDGLFIGVFAFGPWEQIVPATPEPDPLDRAVGQGGGRAQAEGAAKVRALPDSAGGQSGGPTPSVGFADTSPARGEEGGGGGAGG